MRIKSLLLAALLAALTISLAVAKTYTITLASPAKAGSLELKAGEYEVKLTGNKVTFTETKSLKSFTVDGKIETAPKAFPETRVDSSTDGATRTITDIELGGSKTKIDF